MKTSLISALMLAAMPAHAATPALAAPIQKMADAFNKGDLAAAKAVHVTSPTIVDNVAPFIWSGPKAFDTWIADLGKAEAAAGKTDGVVTFGNAVDEVVDGARAYVVTPSSYVYKQNGRAMQEKGMVAFTLVKAKTGWKVESWSWASPSAVPAK